MEGREHPYKRLEAQVLPLHHRVLEVMQLLRPPSPTCSVADLAQPRSGYLRPRQANCMCWVDQTQSTSPRIAVKRVRNDQI